MDEPQPSSPDSLLAQRLARLFGPQVDPHISLSPEPPRAPDAEVVAGLLQGGGGLTRYEVRGEIDRGGMGAVLEVWDRELRRPLAMKVALSDPEAGGDSSRRIARFLEEAQITAQLDHPGVVPVHELGVDDAGRVFFTMRRVKGRDLREVLHCVHYRLDGWSDARALSVLLRACEAVAFAHSRGVIHRDLKPANIMVGSFGEVYVMDWGLARVVGRTPHAAPTPQAGLSTVLRDAREGSPASPLVTLAGDVLGTPAYMAPEQARGEHEDLSPRTDVYALGAMLYHLLAHEPPYFPRDKPTTVIEAMAALRRGPPRPLDQVRGGLPPELVAICEKAMAYEAPARYPDVEALAADLRAFLEQRVVAAYEGGPWAEARKWVRRNRPLAAALAAVLLALVGGLAATLWQFRRAEDRAHEASENAALAHARAAQVLRLSDLQRLSELESEADALWPALPERERDLAAWLTRADGLLANLGGHRETLERLHGREDPAGSAPEAEIAFDKVELRWQHDLLDELVDGLARLTDPDPSLGLRTNVAQRLDLARRIEARSIGSEAAVQAWAAAAAAVQADPRYRGLTLAPQVGLLPLGPDPASGLWEFAHLPSGEPARRGSDGRLQLEQATGVVLVLVPPGRFLMGAQADDPSAPNYDPSAQPDEGPPHEVELEAFLLSKYELTQAQWLRASGENPSVFAPERFGADWNRDGAPGSLLHPVEKVSWLDCARVLPRLDLELPGEAQWEYAARAGSTSAWWTGDEVASLRSAANLADAFAGRRGGMHPEIEPELDDGFACHAPVGRLAANAFGLHDVAGNVIEWCADDFVPYRAGAGARDARPAHQPATHPRRGGGWVLSARFARSACRNAGVATFHSQSLGVRPARSLR